jgi:hypothetical protein
MSVQCTNKLINNSINIGKPTYIEYIIKNKNANYINALNTLGEMGDISAADIMHDLLADAPDTAAQKAGIMSNSVADIFGKILGDKYTRYKTSKELITFIDELFKFCSSLNNHGGFNNEYMGKRIIIELFNIYKRKIKVDVTWNSLEHFFSIFCTNKYNYNNLADVCTNIYNEEVKVQEDIGKAIDRVKDNLRNQQDCPICYETLAGTNNIVVVLFHVNHVDLKVLMLKK